MPNYYGIGLYVGAETPNDWGFSAYQKVAKATALGSTATHLVVGIPKNGLGQTIIQAFNVKGEASDAYSKATEHPGQMAYIALFDKTNQDLADNGFLLDEALLTSTSVVNTHTKRDTTKTRESSWGWIVAGLVGVGGLVLTGRKKKHV